MEPPPTTTTTDPSPRPLKRPRVGPLGDVSGETAEGLENLTKLRALLLGILRIPAELIEMVVNQVLLPNFEPMKRGFNFLRRVGPGDFGEVLEPGYSSRERMDHARQQAWRQIRLFYRLGRFDIEDSDRVAKLPLLERTLRDVLESPRLRTLLYQAWLGRPRRALWDPRWREPWTAAADVSEVPLLSAHLVKSWTTTGRPRALKPRWYGVFVADAYANDYLGWVTRTAWRASLRPIQRTEAEWKRLIGWEEGDPEVPVPTVPGFDRWSQVEVSRSPYGDIMYLVAMAQLPGQKPSEFVDMDRDGLLAPGVNRLLLRDKWELTLSDDPHYVKFPGSELIPTQFVAHRRVRGRDEMRMEETGQDSWWYRPLRTVARALAASTVIRVPSLDVVKLYHERWVETDILQRFIAARPLRRDESPTLRRSTVTVLGATGDATVSATRRRLLVFDKPVLSVDHRTIQFGIRDPANLRLEVGTVPLRLDRSLVFRNVRLANMRYLNGRILRGLFNSSRLPSELAREGSNDVYQPPRLWLSAASVSVRKLPTLSKVQRQRGVSEVVQWDRNLRSSFVLLLDKPIDAATMLTAEHLQEQVLWQHTVDGGAPYRPGVEQEVYQELLVASLGRHRGTRRPTLLTKIASE